MKVELCADAIVSAAARRLILVGGGGAPRVQKNRRRRRRAALFSHIKFKDSRQNLQISFYPQNFLMTFFSHRYKIARKNTAKMPSAARRQTIGGAPMNKSRRGGAHKLSAAAARLGRRTALSEGLQPMSHNYV